MTVDVTIAHGKYRYVQDDRGQVTVYRDGKEWFSSGAENNRLLRALALDLQEARDTIKMLDKHVVLKETTK